MCFNHNTETVPRLYVRVRRNAKYQRTLDQLKAGQGRGSDIATKSGPDARTGRDDGRGVVLMSPRTCAASASKC